MAVVAEVEVEADGGDAGTALGVCTALVVCNGCRSSGGGRGSCSRAEKRNKKLTATTQIPHVDENLFPYKAPPATSANSE